MAKRLSLLRRALSEPSSKIGESMLKVLAQALEHLLVPSVRIIEPSLQSIHKCVDIILVSPVELIQTNEALLGNPPILVQPPHHVLHGSHAVLAEPDLAHALVELLGLIA